jgi:hypothetical protein
MKYKLPKIEVYITNVCNLTCENCNRFNNHKFSGFQKWQDYADIYRQWAKLVDVKTFVIMGGEPTLNPTLTEWITGLNDAFKVNVQVLTNGTQLDKVHGLYDTMTDIPNINFRNHIGVSLHNVNHFENLRAIIKNFLQGEVTEWGTAINVPPPTEWDAVPGRLDYYVARDKNNAKVTMHLGNEFFEAAIQLSSNGRFTLYNSNPVLAHQSCGFAMYKSYHFVRGKLYKCGPVALFPEFDQQHNLDISEQDRKLLSAYVPLTVENFDFYAETFLRELDNPIPQCKFCPVIKKAVPIFPERKGSL